MSIFDEMPGIFAEALGELAFSDAFLIRRGVPTGPSYDPTPGAPQEWACKALVDNWSASVRAGGLVASADRKLLILSATLATQPLEGDYVKVKEGTYLIVSEGGSQPAVSIDPANVLWECRGRG